MKKRLIPCLYMREEKAWKDAACKEALSEDAVSLAFSYCNHGADALLIFDTSETDRDHEKTIHALGRICENAQAPVLAGGNVHRLEDVKKILYAGALKAIINFSQKASLALLEEATKRFGKERLAVAIRDFDTFFKHHEEIAAYSSEIIYMPAVDVHSVESIAHMPGIALSLSEEAAVLEEILSMESVSGLSGSFVSAPGRDLSAFKDACLRRGLPMQVLETAVSFADFHTNEAGLIPVITQDYKTGEVLMMAYMNREAFEKTLQTGKMVYFSRSRGCLWLKGETSGHYQYVKSMAVDCDKDTLLAKVAQIGAACHTGHGSCFYTPLFGREYDEKNPLLILESVMKTITDRKKNPKEGSYTNYLFDKGLDKILKKVGEEAAEIIIAAKNTEEEEVVYEMADFLYHMMVLMAERGVSWEDIITELARR